MATIAQRDPIAPPPPVGPEPKEALAALQAVREQTLALVSHLSDAQLQAVLSPIMSPLVWDLAHIAAYEDLWLVHRHGGQDLLRGDLAELYDAFETPRSVRGEVELLVPLDARRYLEDVRDRTERALTAVGTGDGTVYEMVLRHELQHTETMRQTMALAGLLPAGEPPLVALSATDAIAGPSRVEEDAPVWVTVPAGPFAMGAGPEVFAYDNERPRYIVDLPAFQIAVHPVTNASWTRVMGGSPQGPPDASVCHVSWFEAHQFAEAQGARLPSETEWEKAATLELLRGVGEVWEWTSSCFNGYPGFVAHPYKEYSEVFFGEDYRVLRGGSWATSPRVKTTTFRNWDLPIRSQIFSGVRLARDMV
ncbi:MAG: SUMF1/EgtB/PvdO family nonheme iron enzyme [Solirubrobacteraceae bacterium]